MTGLTAQPGLRPCGDSDCIRLHFAANLHAIDAVTFNNAINADQPDL